MLRIPLFKTHAHWQTPSARRRNKQATTATWKTYWPRMLAGLVMGLCIAGGMWIWKQISDPNTLPFREVRIQGQFNHLNLPQLQKSAKQSINGGFFTLDMQNVRKTLMVFPWAEDVSIRRLPGILVIAIKEHQPIARWNDKYLFNSDKQIFLAPQDAPSDLPLLQGPESQSEVVLNSYQQMSHLLGSVHLKISQLNLNERGSWQMTLNNGIVVNIGREEIITRIQKLVYWYPKLIGDKADKVTTVDLRYPNSIAIAWKNS